MNNEHKMNVEKAKSNALAQLETTAQRVAKTYDINQTLASIILLEGMLIGVSACETAAGLAQQMPAMATA